MNKNFSVGLNIVLVIAVIVLYYLHFTSSGSGSVANETGDSAKVVLPPVMAPKEIKASKVVYINSDVLNEKYEFVKDLTAEAQSKQRRLESNYQSKAQKLQADYEDFQQKANAGLLSENQMNSAQNDLMKRKEELDNMQLQLDALIDEVAAANEQVRQNVIDYVKEYNKTGQYNYIMTYTDGPGGIILLANDSLDITSEIVEGLNQRYSAQKTAKKK